MNAMDKILEKLDTESSGKVVDDELALALNSIKNEFQKHDEVKETSWQELRKRAKILDTLFA